MSKFSDIVNGWKNVIFPNERVEEIAKKRLAICVGNDGKLPCLYLSTRGADHCRICKCPIEAKVRSVTMTNKCPMGKWEAETSEIVSV